LDELISNEDLRSLVEHRAMPCISIYMTTERMGQETRQNPIRLKNLVNKAQSQLNKLGFGGQEVDSLLKPAVDLIDHQIFWQHQHHGLVLFLSEAINRIWQFPLNFEELVVVGRRFHLKPILPLLVGNGSYYLLSLDLKQSTLYRGSRYFLDVVEVPGMPAGMEDALRFDDPEKSLQFRTTSRTEGGKDAMFHGHGDEYDKKDNILRYFQQVDRAVRDWMGGQSAPLLLAGVDYLLPLYEKANSYPNLIPEGLDTDVKFLKEPELRERAWNRLESLFQKDEDDARDSYHIACDEGRSSHDLMEIVPAAYFGRVQTLFVDLDEQCWGTFDSQSSEVVLTDDAEGSQDLLDYAAVHTLDKGGKVFAVKSDQVPDGGSIAAIFRY
jgi:hypothetical protein